MLLPCAGRPEMRPLAQQASPKIRLPKSLDETMKITSAPAAPLPVLDAGFGIGERIGDENRKPAK